jgi:YD repeat-containing protein
MKKLVQFSFVFSLIFVLLLTSCNSGGRKDGASVKYFRHIMFTETAYDQIKGTHTITAKEATDINHYRFTYDGKGRLTEVAFMRGDSLLGYSSMGAARVQIDYTDSTETHHSFDKNNKPKENDGIFANVYKLNREGLRTGLKFLNKDGIQIQDRDSVFYFTWKVLPDSMVKENRYNIKGAETIRSKNCPFYELRFSYNKKGYPVRLANYMADTLYNCTAENCGEIGVSYFDFVTNDEGDLLQFSVHNASGRSSNLYGGWSKFINTIDPNGNVTERVFFDQDNEYVGGKRNPITADAFDEHGALIERKLMDKDHKLMNNEAGVAIFKYVYNKAGNPIDTLKFNSANEEIKKKAEAAKTM